MSQARVPEAIVYRCEELIRRGERLLTSGSWPGQIDAHDMWITETKNFLLVNAPDYVPKIATVGQVYVPDIASNYRAYYNYIQAQVEVLREARAHLQEKGINESEFIKTLQDSGLRERCKDVLGRTKYYDSLVREAIVVLEDRLRKMPGVQAGTGRQSIAVNALSPKAGAYQLGDDEGQRQSAQFRPS